MLDENNYDETNHEINHEPMVRLITFTLENETYGLEVGQVREILRINQNFPVPGAPDYVLGITNIRGNVITILDARRRFNLAIVEHTASTRMIVVESNDDTVAVVVDSVSDVIDVPKSSINVNMKVNLNGDTRFISGVVTHANGLIIILNVEKFITEEQFDMVAGF
jgi:purine-binding chemotaxis protein CheW